MNDGPATIQPQPDPAYHPLVRGIARALRQRCGVEDGAGVVVAVSGGADSVALVRALHTLAPRRRWRLGLVVAHVQHHLRGRAAEEDAAMVADLARQLGLAHDRADLEDLAEAAGNGEASARRARYAALAAIADRRGCGWIATAHHGDDQLETQIMRLIRGSGVRGLGGIAWRRRVTADSAIRLIRPMLDGDRALVRSYLGALGQGWCEDHTNADVSRSRARLRRDVLPVLRELNPAAARRAVATGDHCRAMDRAIDRAVDQAWARCVHEEGGDEDEGKEGVVWVDRAAARELRAAVLGALLRAVLVERGVPGDRVARSTVGAMARAMRDREGGVRRFPLAGGASAELTRDRLCVTRTRI